MKKRESGAALIVGLVLLTIALLLGLSSFQTSRLEESMTGNQRAMELAHMAAETGTSRFYSWLRNQSEWPSSSGDLDYNTEGGVGDYARYEIAGACWGDVASDFVSCVEDFSADHVTLWMEGLSERDEIVSNIVSRYRKLPSPDKSAAFTCFGEHCADQVGGNASLTGEDYHLPDQFDCGGSGGGASTCESDPSGLDPQYDAYYPNIPYEEHPSVDDCSSFFTEVDDYTICDGTYYGVNDEYAALEYWHSFLDFIEASGFDESLDGGGNLNSNIGGRDDYDPSSVDQSEEFWQSVSPKFIEILPDPSPNTDKSVKVNSHTNTVGVIVVRAGATLEYAGGGTHEGLIIVEPGGTLTASQGTPRVYGGIVALQDLGGETAELTISGNISIRYSSAAWRAILQDGKGVRLVAWYEDVSQPTPQTDS